MVSEEFVDEEDLLEGSGDCVRLRVRMDDFG